MFSGAAHLLFINHNNLHTVSSYRVMSGHQL